MEDQGLGINRRALLTLLLGVVCLFVWRHLSQLDERFFQPSLDGVKGLVFYEFGDYARAADSYRAHMKATSLNLLDMGDFQAASKHAEEALAGNPRDTPALLDLGELALESGQPGEARKYFDRVLGIQVNQPDALLLSSVASARLKQYGRAIDALNRALRDWNVETRPASFLLALRTTGELSDLPRKERPLCLLAHYHRYLRIFDTSHARLVKSYAWQAIDAGDHVDDAYVALAVVYDKEGDQGKAIDALQKAIEADPGNIYARTTAARLYSDRGDLANEYQMLKAAYERAPSDAFVVSKYSFLLSEKLADYQQALTIAQASLDLDPNNSTLLTETAYLYQSLGENMRALDYYQKAVVLDPADVEAHGRIAHIMGFVLRRYDDAIASYRTALALDPARSSFYTGLGNLYFYKGDVSRAIAFHEQAFLHGSHKVGDLVSLCSIYFKAGAFQKSADCANQVLTVDPKNIGAAKIRSFAVSNLPVRKTT